jgi:hypothetical protein
MAMVDSEFTRKILDIKALRRDFNEGMHACFSAQTGCVRSTLGNICGGCFQRRREYEKVKDVKPSLAIVSPLACHRFMR